MRVQLFANYWQGNTKENDNFCLPAWYLGLELRGSITRRFPGVAHSANDGMKVEDDFRILQDMAL